MFDVSNTQQQPFMQAGYGANAELSRLLGITPQSATGGAAGVKDSWDESNGRLVGNTYLPNDVELRSTDGGKGRYFDVYRNGEALGQLRPGGTNGIFSHTGAAIPTPGDLATPVGGSAGTGKDAATTGGTGLATGYLSQTFGPDQFKAGVDPGYQFRQQQGNQGVMNAAASTSGSLSGPALKALMDYNQASASQEYGAAFDRFQTQQGNIFQRLSSLADRGQASAAGVGNQAVATGGNIGANIIGAGNASAAGTIGSANAIGGALSDIGAWAYIDKNKPPPVTPVKPG